MTVDQDQGGRMVADLATKLENLIAESRRWLPVCAVAKDTAFLGRLQRDLENLWRATCEVRRRVPQEWQGEPAAWQAIMAMENILTAAVTKDGQFDHGAIDRWKPDTATLEALEAILTRLRPPTAVISLGDDADAPEAEYGPVKLYGPDRSAVVFGEKMPKWRSEEQYLVVKALGEAGTDGLTASQLPVVTRIHTAAQIVTDLRATHRAWEAALTRPGRRGGPNYGINSTAKYP